jgi:leucine-rich repeat protein SHOC2
MKRDKGIPTSKIDFEALVKTHGYVNARQLLKRSMAEEHQAETVKKEIELDNSLENLRVREATKLSKTAGGVGNKTLIDKLIATNGSLAALERCLESGNIKDLIRQNEGKKKEKNDSFQPNDRVQFAMNNADLTLLLPNADLQEFPSELGDTLFLQLSYFQSLKCVRNQFRSLISYNLPQLSLHHFRYLQTIDLSLNKLMRLPDNIGDLKHLHTLNLSNNFISKLPVSFSRLKNLRTLDLSANSFSTLPEEFGFIDSLTNLNISENLFTLFPYAVIRLRNIKKLSFVKNSVNNLAILPPRLTEKDLWMPHIDRRTGRNMWMNILTREKVDHIEQYDGEGVKKKKDLHVFQSDFEIKKYKQRKMYLSVCGIHEWEPAIDSRTGLTYYKNNVSGQTSWQLPDLLNTFGNMSSIQELILKSNAIKCLPSSFTNLIYLTKLSLIRNRIVELPEEFGNLKSLQYLELSNNELKLLPVSLCECKELLELLLEDNHLLRLPENLGFLPKLTKLDISHNHLKAVPFSLGYCRTLKTLFANENPLEDPSSSEFEKSVLNIEHILWYLRNKYLIEKHGKPPLMEFHTISVNNEIIILEQELQETIQTRVNSSVREGFLNLQLLGLKEIPPAIFKAPHLRKLKLDFNPELAFPEGFPKELKKIHSLSIRGCKLKALPENIYLFEKLNHLNLEENQLENLPEAVAELLSLTNLSKKTTFLFIVFFLFTSNYCSA